MNGPIFYEYLKQIVSNINKENDFNLNETINNCLSIIRKEVLDKPVEFYSDKMNEKISNGHGPKFSRGFTRKSYSESFQYASLSM